MKKKIILIIDNEGKHWKASPYFPNVFYCFEEKLFSGKLLEGFSLPCKLILFEKL